MCKNVEEWGSRHKSVELLKISRCRVLYPRSDGCNFVLNRFVEVYLIHEELHMSNAYNWMSSDMCVNLSPHQCYKHTQHLPECLCIHFSCFEFLCGKSTLCEVYPNYKFWFAQYHIASTRHNVVQKISKVIIKL
jgi:hypothetical protein